jgi:hypothetical protein
MGITRRHLLLLLPSAALAWKYVLAGLTRLTILKTEFSGIGILPPSGRVRRPTQLTAGLSCGGILRHFRTSQNGPSEWGREKLPTAHDSSSDETSITTTSIRDETFFLRWITVSQNGTRRFCWTYSARMRALRASRRTY